MRRSPKINKRSALPFPQRQYLMTSLTIHRMLDPCRSKRVQELMTSTSVKFPIIRAFGMSLRKLQAGEIDQEEFEAITKRFLQSMFGKRFTFNAILNFNLENAFHGQTFEELEVVEILRQHLDALSRLIKNVR